MGMAHVLVADDDDVTLEMLDAALQDGHRVTTARNGRQALQLVRDHAVDLVLLDVDMPDIDGYQACEALKAHPDTADLPVIFLSAKVNLEERLRGYRVGAHDYLTKPFEVPELTTKIRLAVEQRERQRQLNGQFEEAVNTALTSANMYGEVGVVLALQRQLATCRGYEDIAQAFFGALEQVGFEGCLRLSGRLGVLSRNARTDCSALENSLLDHLERVPGPSVQAVGDNTCFRYGHVLILVRHLPMNPSGIGLGQDECDRLARVRDNIALMAEGLLARMHSLDVEIENSRLGQARELVQITHEALVDISAQQHANRLHMGQVFQRMRIEIEHSFIHLGLTEQQEDFLANTMQRHIHDALSVFDEGNEIEQHLDRLIQRLHEHAR